MKKILCFGDSNTFGFNPENGRRYDSNTRWTKVLEHLTYQKFKIIEAGCNNRTAFVDNPSGELQTGYKILPKILSTDLDYIIIAIGINDIQYSYNTTLEDVEKGISSIIEIVKNNCPNTKIILLSPSVLNDNILNSYFSTMFDKISIEKSYYYAEIYKRISDKYNCVFLNLSEIAPVSSIDGLHYDSEGHKKIAYALATIINNDCYTNLT